MENAGLLFLVAVIISIPTGLGLTWLEDRQKKKKKEPKVKKDWFDESLEWMDSRLPFDYPDVKPTDPFHPMNRVEQALFTGQPYETIMTREDLRKWQAGLEVPVVDPRLHGATARDAADALAATLRKIEPPRMVLRGEDLRSIL